MTVRVCADDQRGAYVFRCPSCRMAVTKAAEPRIVDLLVVLGRASSRSGACPLELFEQPVGEPLTHDDLLEFHELLESDDWFATSSMVKVGAIESARGRCPSGRRPSAAGLVALLRARPSRLATLAPEVARFASCTPPSPAARRGRSAGQPVRDLREAAEPRR